MSMFWYTTTTSGSGRGILLLTMDDTCAVLVAIVATVQGIDLGEETLTNSADDKLVDRLLVYGT